MSATFCFHISTSNIALKPLRFSLERDELKWTLEAQLHIQSPFFLSNFYYIISFFSQKRGDEKKAFATTLSEYQILSRTLKPWNPYYKPPSHYKQVIPVTNPHLTTSLVRVRMAWSPWSKGHKSIHITTSPVRIRLIWSPWSKGYNHSYMPYRF